MMPDETYLIEDIRKIIEDHRVITVHDLSEKLADHSDIGDFYERLFMLVAQGSIKVVMRIDGMVVPQTLIWADE